MQQQTAKAADLDQPRAQSVNDNSEICVKEVARHCENYKGSDAGKSVFQLLTTLPLFLFTCGVMAYFAPTAYWVSLLLTPLAAGLLTRLFIIQHDCGHGSFFNSKTANNWIGRMIGMLTFTPYDFWRRAHNMHHATSGDLDRRSIGGIDTITVQEYRKLSKFKQLEYRLYRNPLVLLIFGTPFYVMVLQRLPFHQAAHFHDDYKSLPSSSTWQSIMSTNVALALAYGTLGYFTGYGVLFAVYFPILVVTAWIGGWLFFIQHQFEETYWERNENWNKQEAALFGSSYYVMPKILQWFTGNIGLHHIHHLCSHIPNYKLQQCMDDRPELSTLNRLTLRESLGCVKLKLWDEEQGKLVTIDA